MYPSSKFGSTTSKRALAPDLARGLMLGLIALANVGLYLYAREYGFRQQIVESEPINQLTRALTTLLVDGRAYPLFAALFAFGMMQIYQNQQRRGVLLRRCGWLAVFGLIHAALLFPGDILGTYALVGLMVVALRNASDRALLCWAAGWFAATGLIAAAINYDVGPHEDRHYMWSFTMDEPLQALGWRLIDWLHVPFGVTGVFSAAMVGMWAARHGILHNPGNHLHLLLITAVAGLSLGFAGAAPAAFVAGGLWAPDTGALIGALHAVTGILGGIGYLAAITLFAQHLQQRSGYVTAALAACGARSLTCYLAQSFVFVALFVPYTLGLGATIGSAAAALIALCTWVATVVAAWVMARCHYAGPAEIAIRRLTYRTPRASVRLES